MKLPRIISRLFEERSSLESPTTSLSNPAAWLFDAFGARPSAAGVSIGPDQAMRIATVFACVKVLAETVGALPLRIVRDDGVTAEAQPAHPLARLLAREPNPWMTSQAWREASMAHVLLWGNWYTEISRTGRNAVGRLHPLLPQQVEVETQAGRLQYRVREQQPGAAQPSLRERTIRSEDMLHVPGLSYDGVRGLSPIGYARESLGLAWAAQEFGARFFSNDARPGAVFTLPGVLDEKQVARLKDELRAKYQGLGNAHKAMVLEEGMTVTEVGIPPEDAQFLETRKFQAREIYAIFRVPPVFVGDHERATFSNIEHQNRHFAQHTLLPWLTKIEAELDRKLLADDDGGADITARFNLEGLLRGDFKTRMEGYQRAVLTGILTPNEARRMEGRPPTEHGDRALFPMNYTTDPNNPNGERETGTPGAGSADDDGGSSDE